MTNKSWYKITKYDSYYIPNEDDIKYARKYMINDLKLSENLADLMIKNSTEENWPKGLKTKELREKNKERIKQMKGNLLPILLIINPYKK